MDRKSTSKEQSSLSVPPLRSMDDFLLESAKFQAPNFKDLDKWGNRVVSNLLYYQTNYFLAFIVIFLLIGLMHPAQMLVGMISMVLCSFIFTYVSSEGKLIHDLKRQYPAVGVFLVISSVCCLTYTLGSLLIFLLGILLPLSVIFIHSSLRLRSIKNKVVNKIEGIGLVKSPMGALLGHFEEIGYGNNVFKRRLSRDIFLDRKSSKE